MPSDRSAKDVSVAELGVFLRKVSAVISINNLVKETLCSSDLDSVEVDPLREVDTLQEAQLLDSRVSHLTATAALLFEFRTALQFDAGNAALLVVRGLRSFLWESSTARSPLAALAVVSSMPDRFGDSFRARFVFFPDADLDVVGDLAEFYVLAVEGIGDVPPEYSAGNLEGVREHLPSWSSVCSPLQAATSR